MAKILGYQVATNTTVYKETDVQEIEEMFKFFSSLEVDGHTISPGYEYDAAKKDMVKRLGKQPEDFFLTRKMTRQKFAKIEEWGKRFTIFGTPVYQEFLAGKRELTCTAWAIPTRNVRGWKAPCYLMTDGHYAGYQEMLTKVRVGQIRRGGRRGARSALRKLHGALRLRSERRPGHAVRGDSWKNFKYNFGAKPKPYYAGRNRSTPSTASPLAKAIWPRPRRRSISRRRVRLGGFHPAGRTAGQNRKEEQRLLICRHSIFGRNEA